MKSILRKDRKEDIVSKYLRIQSYNADEFVVRLNISTEIYGEDPDIITRQTYSTLNKLLFTEASGSRSDWEINLYGITGNECYFDEKGIPSFSFRCNLPYQDAESRSAKLAGTHRKGAASLVYYPSMLLASLLKNNLFLRGAFVTLPEDDFDGKKVGMLILGESGSGKSNLSLVAYNCGGQVYANSYVRIEYTDNTMYVYPVLYLRDRCIMGMSKKGFEDFRKVGFDSEIELITDPEDRAPKERLMLYPNRGLIDIASAKQPLNLGNFEDLEDLIIADAKGINFGEGSLNIYPASDIENILMLRWNYLINNEFRKILNDFGFPNEGRTKVEYSIDRLIKRSNLPSLLEQIARKCSAFVNVGGNLNPQSFKSGLRELKTIIQKRKEDRKRTEILKEGILNGNSN